MVSPAGIDKVIIKSAAVAPIIPDLLLIETLIIIPSIVKMEQNQSHPELIMKN